MPEMTLVVALALALAACGAALLVLLFRRSAPPASPALDQVPALIERLERTLRDELAAARREAAQSAQAQREESAAAAQAQRDDAAAARREAALQAEAQREALVRSVGASVDVISTGVMNMAELQKNQLESFSARIAQLQAAIEAQGEQLRAALEARLEAVKGAVDTRLKELQDGNERKLDEMRRTVDEKLQGTLEQRLGESFKQVSERLEQVHRGLGEMQQLATGVGDLKKALTNVKIRGTWGEVQLGQLLEQILAPEQYEKNVAVRPESAERVEYAIRLPGRSGTDAAVWLPIDAKFPIEDYQRLVDAAEAADPAAVEAAGAGLETQIRNAAQDIHDKYVAPPHSTDFGIMYLPTEGLYAEVVRRVALVSAIQQKYRIVVAGPTTLAALLNSLQMGFRTLAIEKRSSEVWQILGAVKTEFGKFGDALAAVRRKLDEATSKIDSVEVRKRALDRKLRGVQELPSGDAAGLLSDVVDLNGRAEDAEPLPGDGP